MSTNFHSNKISKEGFQFTCLSAILIDSVLRTGKKYYHQVISEERKYVVKEKRFLSKFLAI